MRRFLKRHAPSVSGPQPLKEPINHRKSGGNAALGSGSGHARKAGGSCCAAVVAKGASVCRPCKAQAFAPEVLLDGRHTFPKCERLQRNYEFRRVYDRGRRWEGRLAVLYVLEPAAEPNAAPGRAFGVVTSRKVGGAVVRNRARRLLREAYRLNKHKLKPRLQMVVVARAAIGGKAFRDIEACLLDLCGRAGLFLAS
jgi:ribonuclease P protein component